MSATAAKGARAYLGGYAVSKDSRDISLSMSIEALDSTAHADDRKRQTSGLESGSGRLSSRWMPGAGRSYEALKAAIQNSPFPYTVALTGTAFGSRVTSAEVITTSVSESAPVGGLLSLDANLEVDGDVYAGVVLHGESEEDTDGIGTAYDSGADSTAGAAIFLHCIEVGDEGGDVELLIEHSSDSSVWEPLATAVVLGQEEAQVVKVTGSVSRYVRVSWDPSTTAVFVVAFARL